MSTKIEWAEDTVSVIGGCTDASDGCTNCYSRGMSHRLNASGIALYEGTTVNLKQGAGVEWTGRINTDLAPLLKLRNTRKPRRVFLNSMSDWMHPGVPTEFIGQMWEEMARQSRQQGHVFMCLTKRPGRIAKVLGPTGIGWYGAEGPVARPEPGIWLGTSIESDEFCWRADRLREAPAAVRFLSLEPLLGPLPSLNLDGIHWVIAGGESGQKARPMHPDWVRDIRDRCVDAGVKFFFKQWGEWGPPDQFDHAGWDDVVWNENGSVVWPDGRVTDTAPGGKSCERVWKAGKKAAGRELDGRTWDEVPEPWIYIDGRGWVSPEQAEVAA
jgi:protein gp37